MNDLIVVGTTVHLQGVSVGSHLRFVYNGRTTEVTGENGGLSGSGGTGLMDYAIDVEDRGGYEPEDDNNAASRPIELHGRDVDSVWQLMSQISASFAASSINYIMAVQTSNSFVNSVLKSIGIELAPYLGDARPADSGIADFAGWETDLRNLVTFNIAGTEGDDWIFSGAKNDTLGGGMGDDQLHGGEGSDKISGGEGSDELFGDGGNDVLDGGAGADKLYGRDGADKLDGGAGDDVLRGGEGADNIKGGVGDDILDGGDINLPASQDDAADVLDGQDGDDYLYGGGGGDTLIGGSGADTIDGGDGIDTSSYESSQERVIVSLQDGFAHGGDAEGDVLVAIENLKGSDFGDSLAGDAGANRLDGGSGDDVLVGNDGVDALYGGGGADVLIAGRIDGQDGTYSGGPSEVIVGGAGTDYLVMTPAEGGKIVVQGGDRGDRLLLHSSLLGLSATTSAGDISLFALLGGVEGTYDSPNLYNWNWMNSNLYVDSVTGESYRLYHYTEQKTGPATYDPSFAISYRYYEAGNRLEIDIEREGTSGLVAQVVVNDFHKGDYGIVLEGPDLLYTVWEVIPGESEFYLDNPEGIAAYDSAVARLIAQSDDYSMSWDGGVAPAQRMAAALPVLAAATLSNSVELRMVLSGSAGNDRLVGNDISEDIYGGGGNDLLRGGGGDDNLYGEDGNDRLVGGKGADQLDGGAGVDTADYRGSSASVMVDLLANSGSGGDALGDSFISIENVVGSAFGDTLRGNAGANVLSGRDGNDSLFGGDGNDRLVGGAGADVLNGGAGVDTVDYRTSLNGVTVDLLNNSGVGGEAQGDTFFFIENVIGSDLADVLRGDAGANRLQGEGDNDSLFGGDGNDRLLGGAGADTLDGGAGTDTADYGSSLVGLTVSMTAGIASTGDAAGDVFIAIENLQGSDFGDALIGDANANRLSGVDGSDILDGKAGNDTLVGGTGSDTLTGDAGADVFSFGLGSGADHITDFWAGKGRTDRIQFTDGQFTDYASLMLAAGDVNGSCVIAINGTDTITLDGVLKAQLNADDFMFA
jgi:Ca2+-binding RTX toxin-like protein